jgi:hypothetical protein
VIEKNINLRWQLLCILDHEHWLIIKPEIIKNICISILLKKKNEIHHHLSSLFLIYWLSSDLFENSETERPNPNTNTFILYSLLSPKSSNSRNFITLLYGNSSLTSFSISFHFLINFIFCMHDIAFVFYILFYVFFWII